ncbi:MAG: hypothetical protein AAF570_22015, partial [Bacteroidota bacterium]
QNFCYGTSNPAITKIVLDNSGTGPARDVIVDIWLGGPNSVTSGQISRFDTSNVVIVDQNGVVTPVSPFYVENGISTGNYACLGPNPIRRLKVLIPSIPAGERDTLIVNQLSCCKTWCPASPITVHRSYYQVEYNDQCFTSNYLEPSNIITSWNYGRILSLTANGPTDLSVGDTANFCLEHSNFRYYNFTPGAHAWADFILPPSVSYPNQPGDLFFEDVQGDLWNPTNIQIIGDTVRAFFDLPVTPGFSMEKANLKINLVPDCPTTCAGGPSIIDYTMYQRPDTSCPCIETIGCFSFPLNVHCGYCPAQCADGGMVFTGFESIRENYGLPDNNDDGLPDGSGSINMSQVRTKYLMLRDTLYTQFQGFIDTTTANPFWTEAFAQSTITRGSNLTAISYDVRIVDVSAGATYNCTLPAPTIGTTGTTRTWTFQLDTASLSGCVPTGFVYEEPDSVEVTVRYVVSSNPGSIVQGQSITNAFATVNPTSGLVAGCDNYSGSMVLVGCASFVVPRNG